MNSVADPDRLERGRLIGMMQRCCDALRSRDWRQLPVSPSLRCTENGCAIALGSGIWRTIRGLHARGHHFVDVQRAQVEYWTVADEMGVEVLLGIRLAVAGRLIDEIESIVVRVGARDVNPVDLPAMLNAPASFHDVLPAAERTPAAGLIAVANSYFDAIELSDGSRLRVADDCMRYVNGIVDSAMEAGDVAREVANRSGEQAHRGKRITDQMSAGDYAYIEGLRDRRFPIIDEARGLVMAHVMFDHPGDLSRSSGEVTMPAPNSLLAFEVFKVRSGTLAAVWALGTILPYGMTTGWQEDSFK